MSAEYLSIYLCILQFISLSVYSFKCINLTLLLNLLLSILSFSDEIIMR